MARHVSSLIGERDWPAESITRSQIKFHGLFLQVHGQFLRLITQCSRAPTTPALRVSTSNVAARPGRSGPNRTNGRADRKYAAHCCGGGQRATPGPLLDPLLAHAPRPTLFFSYVNDTGFWLVKHIFGMSVDETLKTWSTMDTLLSVFGLIFALACSLVV